MKANYNKIILTLILLGSGFMLYAGWKLFWFLTDDAFIAFRYVNNGVLGYGYTWNPPPFRPVEGYTSFLWVALLDFSWRVFGIQPPDIVNHLSLGFSYLTLTLVVWSVWRMKLNPAFERFRPFFLSLILLGILTNRTFLAWTSSGMETAMFNFFFTLWIVLAVFGDNQSHLGLVGLTGSAALVYLSRPDGIVVVLCTMLMLFFSLYGRIKRGELNKIWFFSISPLLAVAIHLFWRKSYYGEWLPNTYYAKYVASWPEAGIKYFASFVLEYALWIWFFLFFAFALAGFMNLHNDRPKQKKIPHKSRKTISTYSSTFEAAFPVLAFLTVVIQVGYYTLMVGGDHFEYRVYSYLVPLFFISFLRMLHALNFKPITAIAAFCMLILLSLPIPWTHWMLTKNKTDRREAHILIAPVSNKFPSFLRWYTEVFDDLQGWLIKHHICMRHQEHKVFYEFHKNAYPPREEGEKIKGDGHPVLATATVGVPGWVLPHVAILDQFGLNDYVIARSPFHARTRLMAHDRVAPPGYVESFQPNVSVPRPGQLEYKQRQRALTADNIIAIENYWRIEIKRLRGVMARGF
jgi:arabinofuranosyltransferase